MFGISPGNSHDDLFVEFDAIPQGSTSGKTAGLDIEAASGRGNAYSHNIEITKIVRSRLKPADRKVKLEICLRIVNRLTRLSWLIDS